MSAVTAAAIVGMGVSLYSGYESNKKQKDAEAQANAANAANQGITSELKARQQALVDKTLTQKLAELQGSKITPEGQQALTQFQYGMGQNDKSIQEQAPLAGEGVTGSRELTQQFRKAQGVANINLADQANKNAEIQKYMGIAQQTPGWAAYGMDANTQAMQLANMRANQAGAESDSSYASAAKGMQALAMEYAKNHPDQPRTADTPSGDTYIPNTQTVAQLRAQGLL